jgi:hypothetical protein
MKFFFEDGLVCQRFPQYKSIHCNVPHFHKIHSPSGFDWGYVGAGPLDLSFNTLTLMSDSVFAKEWYQQFTAEIILSIPIEGGSVPIQTIRDWVREKKQFANLV